MIAEMNLAKLRRSKNITQGKLAGSLDMTQPSIAQLEGRSDTYVSTLRSYVNALGGELEITANFPDGTKVLIKQFDEKTS